MRRIFSILVLCIAVVTANAQKDPTDYVSTLVGSQSSYELSSGNTYPAIAAPWGMNFWTPQTGRMGDGWQYKYTDNLIRGFKQTHQPSPWINDYGQFAVMPVTNSRSYYEDNRASWFSHKAETAKPYIYKVYLADHDISVQLAPTSRAAVMNFRYAAGDSAYVVIDALDKGSHIEVIREENKVIGYSTKNSGGVPDNFKNYFVMTFDRPITYVATVCDSVKSVGKNMADGNHVYAIVGFGTGSRELNMHTASSFISHEQAELNLKEVLGKSIDEVAEAGRKTWNYWLGRIEIEDDNKDNMRTFYSCLYRSLLFPRMFYEYDAEGKAVHYSPYNGKVLPGKMYTDTGFWDTFRCLFPLLNLVYPSINEEIQEGLVNAYKESGFLPEWASPGHRGCMVGNNSASIVADAYLSGLRGYDIETLWKAVVHGTENVHPEVSSTGRLGHEYYNSIGYVPYDAGINENAARTLEYAYDDWCIYKLGKALGKPEKEIAKFAKRAYNFKNLFDKRYNLMSGRKKNGEFLDNFNPLKWGDAFTEGNSWHYTWSVFHDPASLIELMGGRDAFNAKMDSVFSIPPLFDDSYYGFVIHEIREMQIMDMGNYAHGNQPIQHFTYLYDYSGQPWKTQMRVRQVMDKLYSASPDGYCGDEDNGQTSAWYVFSALGFYPVCPGSQQYAAGAPLFRKATIHMENGKDVVIDAPNNSSENFYINGLKINGKAYNKTYYTLDLMRSGAHFSFDMSSRPNVKRGTEKKDAPYSFSTEKK